MKKLILALTVVLILAICSTALAVPNNVTYSTTRKFLSLMDEKELNYSYMGIDSDNDEKVTVGYTSSSNNYSINVNYFFSEDNEKCSIRVWNFIDFDANKLEAAYQLCNDMNTTYNYLKFYVDARDNSITVSYDLITRDDDSVADECLEALLHIVSICNDCYANFDAIK